MNNINVIIVDDEKLIREGLSIILGSTPWINIAGLCSNGKEALELCRSKEVDIVLMDIRMPVCDGVMGTKLIKDEFSKIKILVLTTFKDDEYIYDAMKYGASGYLLKDTSYESIIDSIKSVYNGSIVVHPEIASKLIGNIQDKNKNTIDEIMKNFKLTQREVEIITGIGSGLTNKEIADKLYITEGTVKNYISDILSKLELRDRTQIAIFALRNSLV